MVTTTSPTQKIYTFIQKICKKHKVFPKHILQLGGKNGELLKRFAEHSKVFGISDNSHIVAQNKKEIPQGKFYCQSLANFRIAFSGQCIVSVGCELNELTSFAKRERVFEKAMHHLEPYGLFIFTIKTFSWYETHITGQETLIQNGDTYTFCKTEKSKNNIYTSTYKTFIQQQSGLYSLSESNIARTTFALTDIKKSLSPYFATIEIVDITNKKPSKTAKEVWFVCQKGWETT